MYYTTWKTQQVTLLRIAANSYGQTKWENPWWKVSWRILGRHVISPQQETQNNIQYSHHPRPTPKIAHSLVSTIRRQRWRHCSGQIMAFSLDTNDLFGYQRGHVVFFWSTPSSSCLCRSSLAAPQTSKSRGVALGDLLFVPLQTAIKSHLFKMIMLK